MAGEQSHKRVASSAAPAEAEMRRGVTDEVLAVATGASEDVAHQEGVCLSARAISVIDEPRSQPQHCTPNSNPGDRTIEGYPGFDTMGACENSEDAASDRPTTEKRAAVDGSDQLLASQIASGARAAWLESSMNKTSENPSLPNFEARKSSQNGPLASPSRAVRNDDGVNPTNTDCSHEAPAESVVYIANESGGQNASLRWSREHKSARSLVDTKELEEEGIVAGMSTVSPPAEPAGITVAAVEPDVSRSVDDIYRANSAEVAVAAAAAADEPAARVTQVKSFAISGRTNSHGMRPDIVLSASSESGTTLEDDARSRVAEAVGDRPLSGGWAAGVSSSAGTSPVPLSETFHSNGRNSQTPRPSIIQSDGSFSSSTAGSQQTASSMTRDGSSSVGRDWGINFKVGTDLLEFTDSVTSSPREREAVGDGGPGSVHADMKGLEGTLLRKRDIDLDSACSIHEVANAKEAVSYLGLRLKSTVRSASDSANESVDIETHPNEAAAAVAAQDVGKQGVPVAAPPSVAADRTVDRVCTGVDSAPGVAPSMCLTTKVGAAETNPAHKDRCVEARFPRSTSLSGSDTTPVEEQHVSDSRIPAVVETKMFPERHNPKDSALHNASVSTHFQREGGKLDNMFPCRLGIGGPWVGGNEVEAGGDDSVGMSVEEAAAIMGGNPCLRFASGSSWTTTATSTAMGDAGALVPTGSPATAAKRGGLKLDDGTSFGSFADPHDFISPEPEGCDGNTRVRKIVSEFFLAPMLSPGDPLLVNVSLGAAASVGDVSGSNVGFNGRNNSAVVSSSLGVEASTAPIAIETVCQADREADDDTMADGSGVDYLVPSPGGEEENAPTPVSVVRESEVEVGGVDSAASASAPVDVTPPVTAEGCKLRVKPRPMSVVWSAGDDAGVDIIGGRGSEDDSLKVGDVANNHTITGNAEATGDLSMMGGEAELPRPGNGGCCVLS